MSFGDEHPDAPPDFSTLALEHWLDRSPSRRATVDRVPVRGGRLANEWRVQLLEQGRVVGHGRGAGIDQAIAAAMKDAMARLAADEADAQECDRAADRRLFDRENDLRPEASR